MNIGLILMPMHSNKKAMLWVVETSVMKLSGENRVSFGTPFVLKFKPHSDSRDERPQSYNGRIAALASGKLHRGIFRDMAIVKD